jgi:hypothetical protein
METTGSNRVIVVDVKMPFWSMVTFMVKWAIAAVPAIVILVIVGAMLSAVLGGLFGTLRLRGDSRSWVPADEVALRAAVPLPTAFDRPR